MTRILVVEGSPTQALQTQLVLQAVGFEVETALNGEEALSRVRGATTAYDLVITDVVMPRLSGYDLCRSIKADPELSKTLVLLTTNLRKPTDIFHGLECGADNFVLKPYEPEYLISRVRSLLATRGSRQWVKGETRVVLEGETFRINAQREQILDFLISTFDDFHRAQGREHQSRMAEQRHRLAADAAEERSAIMAEKAKALEESEQRFRHLAETVRVIPWEASLKKGMTYIGPQVQDILGYLPAELIGEDFWGRLLHPDDRESVRLATSVPSGHIWELEYRVEASNGRYVWLRDHVSFVSSKGERLLRGFMVDVTAIKEAEATALASERQLRAIADSTRDAFVSIDGEGRIVSWNQAACRLFGYEEEEALGEPATIIMPERFRSSHREGVARLKGGADTRLEGELLELTGLRRDGSEFPIALTLSSWLLGGERFYTGVVRDITHRKAAEAELGEKEQQLRQSQKMEAVGRLAGGIAHDFNNLLTAISGYTALLLDRTESDEVLHRYATQVQRAAKQATSLTRQLLAFSRKQILAPKVLDLNAVVLEIQPLLRPLLGENARVVHDLDPAPGSVLADPGHLHQVIMNLAVNALDAMPDGGTLSFTTRRIEVDETMAAAHVGFQPGDFVRLAVGDTGGGMDRETLLHLFEPFYTTKDKGTGLGLATVYGIIKQSGGWIWPYSELGAGTTFHIYLPRLQQEAEPPSNQMTRSKLAHALGATILLAEDETMVRQYAMEILTGAGYTVLESRTPHNALELVDQHEGPIDLLLTDVVMPGINGAELAARVRTLRPEIPVLYMSGHTGQVLFGHQLLTPDAPLLTKPFSPSALLRKISEILGAPEEDQG